MRVRFCILFLLTACGSTRPAEPSSTPAAPLVAQASAYDLHEWGLLSVLPGSIELAAGPGRPGPHLPELTVDKPVVYVHAQQATHFSLTVALGPGYELAERWPGVGAPISWQASVSPGPCQTRSAYPDGCQSSDGYCETRELAGYEAADSSCLHVGADYASLLFYRLRATDIAAAGQRLPVKVEPGRVHAATGRTAWRVSFDAAGAGHAQRFSLTPEAQDFDSPPQREVAAAASWAHDELMRLGLTPAERAAFERAWWQRLFHMGATTSDGDRATDMPALPADRRVATDDETTLDLLTADGITPGAPQDTLLYFLQPAEIDAIARLDASPAPRQTHRAFLVLRLL